MISSGVPSSRRRPRAQSRHWKASYKDPGMPLVQPTRPIHYMPSLQRTFMPRHFIHSSVSLAEMSPPQQPPLGPPKPKPHETTATHSANSCPLSVGPASSGANGSTRDTPPDVFRTWHNRNRWLSGCERLFPLFCCHEIPAIADLNQRRLTPAFAQVCGSSPCL